MPATATLLGQSSPHLSVLFKYVSSARIDILQHLRIRFTPASEFNDPFEFMPDMPERGVISSDGVEADFLEFNSGSKAEITVAERKGLLVAWEGAPWNPAVSGAGASG